MGGLCTHGSGRTAGNGLHFKYSERRLLRLPHQQRALSPGGGSATRALSLLTVDCSTRVWPWRTYITCKQVRSTEHARFLSRAPVQDVIQDGILRAREVQICGSIPFRSDGVPRCVLVRNHQPSTLTWAPRGSRGHQGLSKV